MPGLHASADRTVVDAMQQINKAIENRYGGNVHGGRDRCAGRGTPPTRHT
jgi:hypothetical protein